MIVYKDIMTKLKQAGYSSYRIRQEGILSPSVLNRIRHNLPVTTDTLDIICGLLHCDVGEIIAHVEDPGQSPEGKKLP